MDAVNMVKKKRCELHLHTNMTQMGSLIRPDEAIRTASEYGFPAVAITDSGNCTSFPKAAEAAEKYEVKVIYGMEAAITDSDNDKSKAEVFGVVLLACNEVGIKNLYRLTSLGVIRHDIHQKLIISRSDLNTYRDGLLVGSAWDDGELVSAVLENASDDKLAGAAEYYDYFEVQPINDLNTEKEQIKRSAVKKLIETAGKYNKPVIAVDDARCLYPDDEIGLNILSYVAHWMKNDCKSKKHLRTTEQMLSEFGWLGAELAEKIVITNTNLIADKIKSIKPLTEIEKPMFGFAPDNIYGYKNDSAAFRQYCVNAAKALYGEILPDAVWTRFENEWKVISDTVIISAFETIKILTGIAKERGCFITAKGNTANSFLAYLIGANDVNPLPPHYRCADCLYSDFSLQDYPDIKYGGELPDIECPVCHGKMHVDGYGLPFENEARRMEFWVNSEIQADIFKCIYSLFGKERVCNVGKLSLIDCKKAEGFIERYSNEYGIVLTTEERKRLTDLLDGVKRCDGQRPACFLVSPDGYEISDICPVSNQCGDKHISQFPYDDIKPYFLRLDLLANGKNRITALHYEK